MSHRAVMVLPILVMAVMACAVQMAGTTAGSPSPPPSIAVSPSLEVRIDTKSLSPTLPTHIAVSQNVRLRTIPDASGPVDSVELAILRPGDEVQISSCRMVAGNWWAYGSHDGMSGWVSAEFLSPNPCE